MNGGWNDCLGRKLFLKITACYKLLITNNVFIHPPIFHSLFGLDDCSSLVSIVAETSLSSSTSSTSYKGVTFWSDAPSTLTGSFQYRKKAILVQASPTVSLSQSQSRGHDPRAGSSHFQTQLLLYHNSPVHNVHELFHLDTCRSSCSSC